MDKNEKTKNDGTPVEKEAQKPNAGNDKKAPTKGKTVSCGACALDARRRTVP